MIRGLLVWYIARNHFIHAGATLSYMAFIFILSSMKIKPFIQVGLLQELLVNLCHVPLYFGLSMPLSLYTRKLFKVQERGRPSLDWALVAMAILLVFSASDEYHQSFTGRHPTVMDLISDVIGGLAGVLVLSFILDRRPRPGVFWLSLYLLGLVAVTVVYFGIR
jgi:hypothetical protein